MGQKVPPKANRIPYLESWTSQWLNMREAPDLIVKDYQIRQYIKNHYGKAGAISKIEIARTGKRTIISIYTARPGLIIGRRGEEIEKVRTELEKIIGEELDINDVRIFEVDPLLSAQLIADMLAIQIERNVNYRRAMKRMIDRVMSAGRVNGIKIRVSGRLAGAEIARSEWLSQGRMPLGTFRADIDYGFSEAIIKKGKIGVKVWLFKKEMYVKTAKDLLEEARLVEKEKVEAIEEKPFEELISEEPEGTANVDAEKGKI